MCRNYADFKQLAWCCLKGKVDETISPWSLRYAYINIFGDPEVVWWYLSSSGVFPVENMILLTWNLTRLPRPIYSEEESTDNFTLILNAEKQRAGVTWNELLTLWGHLLKLTFHQDINQLIAPACFTELPVVFLFPNPSTLEKLKGLLKLCSCWECGESLRDCRNRFCK